MCSIILITRLAGQPGLMVAANRDEKLDRPATGPTLEAEAPIARLRPIDQSQGGTWLGINAMGVFAGITNRFMAPADPSRKSRGELPLFALEEPSARMAANRLSAINAYDYNAFHLVIADLKEAWVVWSDGTLLQREALLPGIHVITESSYGAGENLRRNYLLTRATEIANAPSSTLSGLTTLLGESLEESFHGPCVYLPAIGYGTRSSTLIAWGNTPEERIFQHSPVPPNQPQWQDHSQVLRDWT